MSLYLYGLVASDGPASWGRIGFPDASGEPGEVEAVAAGRFAVLTTRSPVADLGRVRRKELAELLLAHQRTLERAMQRSFVLPFKFGTVLDGRERAVAVVRESEPRLAEWFARFQDTWESELVVTWDPAAVVREAAECDAELSRLCATLARGGLGSKEAASLKDAIGRRIQQALAARAERTSREILARLEPTARGRVSHPCLGDQMVLSASFLLDLERAPAFALALDEIDRSFATLRFKCIGPLPPYSFATVDLRDFDAEALDAAWRLLSLPERATADEVERAYKRLSLRCHPDQASEGAPATFVELYEAYALVRRYVEPGGAARPIAAGRAPARLELVSRQVA